MPYVDDKTQYDTFIQNNCTLQVSTYGEQTGWA